MASDKRKQSLYFPEKYLDEIEEESLRQDRSKSWIVQQAWKIARETIMSFPGTEDYEEFAEMAQASDDED